MNENSFQDLLTTLQQGGVEFILIGGLAGMAHGSARATVDVDIVYARNPFNLGKIVASLASTKPYLRGAPPGLPFHLDVATMERGLNFTLTTTIGDLDLLGEVPGGGTFSLLEANSEWLTIFGIEVRAIAQAFFVSAIVCQVFALSERRQAPDVSGSEISSVFRRLAQSILQKDTSINDNIRGKRKGHAWCERTFDRLLAAF